MHANGGDKVPKPNSVYGCICVLDASVDSNSVDSTRFLLI